MVVRSSRWDYITRLLEAPPLWVKWHALPLSTAPMSRTPSLSGTRRSSSSARLARDIPISSDNSHRPAIGFENDSDNKYDNKECRVGIDLEEGELGVDFDGRKITYGFGELDELVLAYATTIHKSQGSEYRPWSSR